jgi:hypothetical protein
VGYYNIVIPAGGYWFVANQTTNFNNQIGQILTNKAGLVSDPNGALNTTIFIWKGAATPGYDIFQYYTDVDAQNQFSPTFGDGWYDSAGTFHNTNVLAEGVGAFLVNPAGVALTNTFYGTVVQGSSSQSVIAGFNAFALKPAISTNIDSALIKFPGKSDPNGVNNSTYFHWKTPGGGYDILQYYTDIDAQNQFSPTFGDGWYDSAGTYYTTGHPEVWPKVGEGFFLLHNGTTSNWSYSFTVQ